jgi:hypothetical protein
MQTMPEWVTVTPDYAPTLRFPQKVKDFKYLSIVDISNPNVKLTKFDGLPYQPKITFKTEETEEQKFSFKIKYHDGAFEVLSNSIECTLKPEPDSIEIYKQAIPGYWTKYTYHDNKVYSTSRYIYRSDGTFSILSIAFTDGQGNQTYDENDIYNREPWWVARFVDKYYLQLANSGLLNYDRMEAYNDTGSLMKKD